jgi:hypothetical protein
MTNLASPNPPPPVPRQVPRSVIWRMLLADLWFVGAVVAEILGLLFLGIGVLMFSLVDETLGWPFFITGALALTISGPLLIWRVLHIQPALRLLSEGRATSGEVREVVQNTRMRINRRHPWIIRYSFQAEGHEYQGVAQRLDPPEFMLQAGQPIYVLYFPENPVKNTLYFAE